MNRFRILLLALLILLANGLLYSPAAHAAADRTTVDAAPAMKAAVGGPAGTYYVSLGDSLAQGIQPNPTTGTDMLTNDGYPDQLLPQLRKYRPSLELVKLGCPGETTTSLIHGGVCPYPMSQLASAVRFLKAHRGHIAYLTLNVGSNDALPCITSTAVDAACFQSALATIATNLTTILAALRSNLDLRTVGTAGITYYDPILVAWLTGNRSLAVQSVVATNALNALERSLYEHFGFRLALVGYAFHTSDFTIAPKSSLPTNVTQICSLTWMCSLGNIHPNKAGYALIAKTLEAVLRCRPHR